MQEDSVILGAMNALPLDGPPPRDPQFLVTEGWIAAADTTLYGEFAGVDAVLPERLNAYGAEVGRYLHGDFAVALWARGHRKLRLIRDHFGVRPLQYTVCHGRYIAFASLPSALIQTGLASRALDADALRVYPITDCAIGPATIFREIKTVPPAHFSEFAGDGNARFRRYWRLPIKPFLSAKASYQEGI